MIRNYYTEAYKGGITPVVSATQLVDGTVKITESVAQAGVVNAATSRTFVLTNVNLIIKRGMYLTAAGGGGGVPAISINDNVIVEAVVYGTATTTVTLNKPKQTALNQALTFFSIAQSSWKEYNLYIGSSPANFQSGVGAKVTQGIADAGTAGTTLEIKTANALVAAGQLIYDDGVLIGTVVSIAANDTTITTTAIPVVADLSVINFVNPGPASVSVLTAANQTMTFVNPAEGFVLPVSVVQVTAVANGLSNLIALD